MPLPVSSAVISRLSVVCFMYALVELWRLWRFRRLLRQLQTRRYAYQGGRGFLAWAKKVVLCNQAPLSLDREVFMLYAREEGRSEGCGYGGGRIDWRRLYAWWAWGCGRPFDPPRDPALHADLLACAAATCQALKIDAPPLAAPAPQEPDLSPFGFGVSEIRATFKPLPIRVFLRGVQLCSRLALSALGFRRLTEPTPEGELVCWSDLPAPGTLGARADGRRPVVFFHGLGLGNFTYLPMFMGQSSREWRAGGCIVVELPCMTSAWADLEGLPQAVHCADALGRLLRKQLGASADLGYDAVCHSLSAYLVAILCNEGSPCRPRRSVLVDPVCFLEGVEVCSRFPFRTPEECRVFAESTVLFPSFLPVIARRLLGRVFRQLVCRDIFTQYSVLRWNGTDATSIFWRNAEAEALVCLSDSDNFVPSARVATHCQGHFPNIKLFHMPGKDHGSFVIEPKLRRQLLERITLFLVDGK